MKFRAILEGYGPVGTKDYDYVGEALESARMASYSYRSLNKITKPLTVSIINTDDQKVVTTYTI